MTPHVSLRLLSALLLVFAWALHSPPPAAAQSVTATQPAPSLQERLDRLAAEIDRNRVDLHVPGAALAIVRGDTVIFARGFGLADVEKQTAMTHQPAGASCSAARRSFCAVRLSRLSPVAAVRRGRNGNDRAAHYLRGAAEKINETEYFHGVDNFVAFRQQGGHMTRSVSSGHVR